MKALTAQTLIRLIELRAELARLLSDMHNVGAVTALRREIKELEERLLKRCKE